MLLQSTLREMRGLARDPRSWAVLAVLGLAIGAMGPFGTFAMPVVLRIAYWSAVVVLTAAAGTFVASLIETALERHWHRLPSALVAGLIAGIPITLIVVGINMVAFGPALQPIDMATLFVYCTLITAAVTVISALLRAGGAPTPADAAMSAAADRPALLDRLPLPQRGRLLHLEVADHYVEVTTDRGKALLLLRLSDAIRETSPVPGLQVHRSHWVALDAVRRAARQDGKPTLELETGEVVPVSRTYLSAARDAGLVP